MLRLTGLFPKGVRTTATESWGMFDFELTNLSDTDRQARVLVFYKGQPDVQYGRDVWVPARSTLSSWLLVGPAPRQDRDNSRDIQYLLQEPGGEERLQSQLVPYEKRAGSTAILVDEEGPKGELFGQLPQPESPVDEAIQFARTFRHAARLSESLRTVSPGMLPVTAEAFDGIDHFMVASGHLADDPAGLRALRHWLEQGGTVWVMLDLVEPEAVAPLLGDVVNFQVVDRVSLAAFKTQKQAVGQGKPEPPVSHQHERAVAFARVQLPAQEQVRYTVDGWPVWFTRAVGRGKVVFTTLGPRAWFRPRNDRDAPSRHPHFPSLPVPIDILMDLAAEIQPLEKEPPFPVKTFTPMLTAEIGYAVVRPGTVGLVFGAFLLAAFALGVALRKLGRAEWLGWLGPGAALGAAAAFVALGESSRRVAPPTVAVGQIVDAGTGTEEVAVQGLLAVYRPDSGPAKVGPTQGGFFHLDMTGLEGQSRRLVLTDMDAWHWDNLALPAGVRLAPFHYTAPTREPITAVARLGPDGVEGKLAAGPFGDVGDALISVPGGRQLAVRPQADGSFRAGSRDILPQEQFLASAVLSDRQQRRHELYRAFLKQPGAGRLKDRNVLLAWADPIDLHFNLAPNARQVGDALLVIPLRMERSAPGTRVTVPGPFLPYRRIMAEGSAPPTLESRLGTSMLLRFQLPPEVLPLKVERARLTLKINAPSRRVTVSGRTGKELVELRHIESPLDPVRLDISDERFLHLDADGGLYLNLAVSNPPKGSGGSGGVAATGENWKIDYLEIEVSGRTE
jgi:hypothetical protein